MKFNIALPYIVSHEDRASEIWKTDRRITDVLIRNAVNAKYPEGIKDRQHQRTWNRISKALTTAILKGDDSVELERSQIEWLLTPLSDWSCPQALVSWLCDLRDSLESSLESKPA